MQLVGAGALNQAIKAVAIARDFLIISAPTSVSCASPGSPTSRSTGRAAPPSACSWRKQGRVEAAARQAVRDDQRAAVGVAKVGIAHRAAVGELKLAREAVEEGVRRGTRCVVRSSCRLEQLHEVAERLCPTMPGRPRTHRPLAPGHRAAGAFTLMFGVVVPSLMTSVQAGRWAHADSAWVRR